mgnify:CR=1 FL=1
MNSQWMQVISPILALSINVIINIVSMHTSQRTSFSVMSGFTAGIIAFLLITHSSVFNPSTCAGLLSYIALSFCYWAFLNLNLTSLRIRLVRELLKEDGHTLTTENIMQRYSPQELISRRIERLEKSKQIQRQGNQWILLSRKLIFIVFVITLLRKLIMPKKVCG